jgi:hypothetical protein
MVWTSNKRVVSISTNLNRISQNKNLIGNVQNDDSRETIRTYKYIYEVQRFRLKSIYYSLIHAPTPSHHHTDCTYMSSNRHTYTRLHTLPSFPPSLHHRLKYLRRNCPHPSKATGNFRMVLLLLCKFYCSSSLRYRLHLVVFMTCIVMTANGRFNWFTKLTDETYPLRSVCKIYFCYRNT